MKNDDFPKLEPVIYWAQSTTEILIMSKIQVAYDMPECYQTFERGVESTSDTLRLHAICMEGEDKITFFDSGDIKLGR
jgi:hypothetical protein